MYIVTLKDQLGNQMFAYTAIKCLAIDKHEAFGVIEENSYYNKARENYAVMEEKRYGPIKKFAKRFKSGKWGEWEDLITEADDYE